MSRFATSGGIGLVLALALGLCAAPAHAQLARTFVSSLGNDANDCNRLTPCRTFQRAHDNTLAAGEIAVLDPGGYGAVTITKGISIINDGVGEAGALVSGGAAGIMINAPGAVVTLRGLTIKGIGFGGGTGIIFAAGNALNVENCTIRNLDGSNVGNGIVFQPSTGTPNLVVTNTLVTDNAANAILVVPTAPAGAIGFLGGVGLHGNGFAGLNVVGTAGGGTIKVTVTDSTATNNGSPGNGGGFIAQSGGAPSTIFLIRSVAANNPSNGVVAFGSAGAVVTESAIVTNASGWLAANGGSIHSYGDNVVVGNGANQAAVPTVGKL